MTRSAGQQGERRAEAWLNGRGLQTVACNYQCRAGEIDLVMLDPHPFDAEVLVFVEVKLRGRQARATGADSVDGHKQRRLVAAARHFLMSHPEWVEHPCRFDVVDIDQHGGEPDWIADAFEAGD